MPIDFSIQHQAEYMGVFGLSWEERVASFVKKQLKGTSYAKKMSDFLQAGGLNVNLIKNMYNEYAALMAQNYQPVSFSYSPDAAGKGGELSPSSISLAAAIGNKTNVDVSIVLEFLRALFVLSRDGKIPMAKWNPAGYKASTQLRKTFETERSGILNAAKKTVNASKGILIVAAVGAVAYLLSQLKQFNYKN